MPTAAIEINGAAASNVALPLNTLVQLSNADAGGETVYLWVILDKPPGSLAALSDPNIENPTFTPDVEGTYLIKETVNGTLTDIKVAAVKQLKSLERVPAAGETLEADASDGWATAVNSALRLLDTMRGDSGLLVVETAAGGLNRGKVLRIASTATLKSGLPGEEKVPGAALCQASTAAHLNGLLAVCEGGVDGSATPAINTLVYARVHGRYATVSGAGASVGDPVYVDNAGDLSRVAGSNTREVGRVMSVSGATYEVWFSGFYPAAADFAGATHGAVYEETGASHTVTPAEEFILCENASTGAVAITLGVGALHLHGRVTVKDKKGDAATYNVNIIADASSGQTIDGAATKVLNGNYQSVSLVFNGTEWSII